MPNLAAAVAQHLTSIYLAKSCPPNRPTSYLRFVSRVPPQIKLDEYVQRFVYYTECVDEVLVHAIVYVFRIHYKHPALEINGWTIHRLLIAALVVAAKYYDDNYDTNETYAQIGGITLQEMNLLEADFLKLIDWELYIKQDETFNALLLSR